MPSDTPNSITGHTDLLLSSESHCLQSKSCDIIEKHLNFKWECMDLKSGCTPLKENNALFF